jgi:hypothetical protein
VRQHPARPNQVHDGQAIMAKAASQSTQVASLFHNLNNGELVDQLGHVKAEAAEVKAREGRAYRPQRHRGDG